MLHIIAIAEKDLRQIVRDRKVFLFMVIMPVIFTLLFGLAFSGAGSPPADPRLPVVVLDEDRSPLSGELVKLLNASKVIRVEPAADGMPAADYEQSVADGDLAGLLVIPAGYGQALLDGKPVPLALRADPATTASTLEGEVSISARRVSGAVTTARIANQATGGAVPFEPALADALAAWQTPPVRVESTSSAPQAGAGGTSFMSMAHSSPAMMLQFAIAGLLTAAQVLVSERKSRALQRLLTTATQRVHILLGHYLAILVMILAQFLLLIAFGQAVLGVDYLRLPAATLLVSLASAMCIAALGLLIGVVARSEEQAVVLSLIPMFILSGLGGAWVPLEITGEAFQAAGHISPVAWAMDGFKNVIARGLGAETVLLPVAALLAYAAVFFVLATWRFQRMEAR